MPWKCTHYPQQELYVSQITGPQTCSFLPSALNCHPPPSSVAAYNRLDTITNFRYRPQDYPVSSQI